MKAENLSGRKIRLILTNGFHYNGEVISECDLFLTILDKYNNEVRINKNEILTLEVKK